MNIKKLLANQGYMHLAIIDKQPQWGYNKANKCIYLEVDKNVL